MAVIADGEGTTSDNFHYRWSLEDAEDGGCKVSVSIDRLAVVRRFPALLSAEEAENISKQLVPSLRLAIDSPR